MRDLSGILRELGAQRQEALADLRRIERAIASLGSAAPRRRGPGRLPKMPAAGSVPTATGKGRGRRRKRRKLSAEARRKMAKAQRRRRAREKRGQAGG